MRNVLQNPQTNTVVQVGTINKISKKFKISVSRKKTTTNTCCR